MVNIHDIISPWNIHKNWVNKNTRYHTVHRGESLDQLSGLFNPWFCLATYFNHPPTGWCRISRQHVFRVTLGAKSTVLCWDGHECVATGNGMARSHGSGTMEPDCGFTSWNLCRKANIICGLHARKVILKNLKQQNQISDVWNAPIWRFLTQLPKWGTRWLWVSSLTKRHRSRC